MCSLPTQPTYRASLPFSLSQSDKTAANAAADHCLGGAAEAANRTHFSSCTTLAALFTAELLGFCLFSKSGPLDPYRCVKHRHPSSEYPAEVKLGRIIFYCLQTGIQTGLRHHVILALTFELPLVTAFFFFGKSLNSVQLFVTPWTVAPSSLLCPWNSPGKSTGLGSCSLLQGIFSTQISNPGLPHCRRILCHLSYHGSPQPLHLLPLTTAPITIQFPEARVLGPRHWKHGSFCQRSHLWPPCSGRSGELLLGLAWALSQSSGRDGIRFTCWENGVDDE